MFVRVSVCLSVCLRGRALWLLLYTVHVSADLSLCLDSPMFWTPWHQNMSTYSQSFFPVPPGRGRVCMDVQYSRDISRAVVVVVQIKLLLSANRKSYIASIITTTDDLRWPWMAASRAFLLSVLLLRVFVMFEMCSIQHFIVKEICAVWSQCTPNTDRWTENIVAIARPRRFVSFYERIALI